jgi:hypothetical protein
MVARCNVCDKIFCTVKYVRDHMAVHHPTTDRDHVRRIAVLEGRRRRHDRVKARELKKKEYALRHAAIRAFHPHDAALLLPFTYEEIDLLLKDFVY